MRIAALVLGMVGGLSAGVIGVKWLLDAAEARPTIEKLSAEGADLSKIHRTITGAYVLLASCALGIGGGILAMMGKGKPAAGALLVGGVAPALFAPAVLVFTSFLLAGSVCSCCTKPKSSKIQ